MADLPGWWQTVSDEMQRQNVPLHIWLPVLMQESRGSPSVTGQPVILPDGRLAHAYGLFQLLSPGGVGDGYSADQLKDPLTNARLAAAELGRGVRTCGPTDLTCVLKTTGWAGSGATAATFALYQHWADLIQNATDAAGAWGAVASQADKTDPQDNSLGAQLSGAVQSGIQGAAGQIGQNALGLLKEGGANLFLGVIGIILILFGLLGVAIRGATAVAGGSENVRTVAGVVAGVASVAGAAPLAAGAGVVKRTAGTIGGRARP